MKPYPLIAGLALVTACFSARVSAGPVAAENQATGKPVSLEVYKAEVTETFQSDFKRGHGDDPSQGGNNHTNTLHYGVEAGRRVQLDDHWYLKLGVYLNRFDFGSNHTFAPNTLQSYAAGIGLEYRVGGQLGFLVESRPGFYFSHDVTGESFDAPTALAFAYPIFDKKVVLVAGLRASILSKYPVLPAGGFIWHINPDWDLLALAPRPRLVFKANETTQIYAGGELAGGAFRADSSVQSRVNGTVVDYYEIRAGAGLSYKPCKAGSLDLGVGYAVMRKFDFFRADETISTEPAPYLRAQFAAEF